MFIYETHMHTGEVSKCCHHSAREMMAFCKAAGYAGAIVTDHFLHGNTHAALSLPWEESVAILMTGYRHARTAAEELGLSLFLGWEATVDGLDFLTYGLDEAFLLAHPELGSLSAPEYTRLVKASGGLAIQAHPYRQAHYILHPGPIAAEALEGVEVMNGGNTQDHQAAANDRALAFARANHLLMTSGSDTHGDEFTCGMAFDHPLADIWDFIACVRAGSGQLLPEV